jgi:hypothetical protein
MERRKDELFVRRLAWAMTCGDLEQVRRGFSEIFLPKGDDPNDPRGREYYEDRIEVMAELCRAWEDPLYGVVLIENIPYTWETVYEQQFLAWLQQLVHRGHSFEEAFNEAKARTIEFSGSFGTHVIYELDQYDRAPVDVWADRLSNQGIEPTKALKMAEDLVRLLRQLYLVGTDEEFAVELFCAEELELRQTIIESLGHAAVADNFVHATA